MPRFRRSAHTARHLGYNTPLIVLSDQTVHNEKMRAKYTKDLPESPAASLLINRALKNYAINEVNIDGNHRVPLEYPTRVHEIKLTFVYDAQGRLTLPDETLLAITQIKNREWKKPSDSQSSDQASDSSDSSSESR